MPCPSIHDSISASEFSAKLQAQPELLSIPLSASMEWTFRCNLACRHCYARFLGHEHWDRPTADIEAALANLADAGVLFLTITGGDPLIRPDFRRLYLHAKELGFVISLFTNATMITADLAAFLAQHPPRRVEISAYGATAATYESVTQRAGSFAQFQRGLEFLQAAGLNVNVKAMLLTLNLHEFEQIKDAAIRINVPFRYDALVSPRLDGDKTPLAWRLSPEETTRLHFYDAEDQRKFAVLAGAPPPPPRQERLFECGAGRLVLHVDPLCQAHPCMQWRHQPLDLMAQPLRAAWPGHVRAILAQPPESGECNTCSKRHLCNYCPAIARLETGSTSSPSLFHCRLAEARIKALSPPFSAG